MIIDTDGGVDDAAALWWAVTNPDIDVVAITVVWGNVGLDVAVTSVARVLSAAGRTDIPIAAGLTGPIGPAPELRAATFIHGDDGLGNTTAGLPPPAIGAGPEPAVDLLRRELEARPGEITLVTLGPLSNVGRLLVDAPEVATAIGELVVMGGSARHGGNALPNAEANVGHDPAAAAAVVAAPWPRPPLLVGLDVTMVATLTEQHFALLAEHRNAAGAFLDAPIRFYRQHGATFTAPDSPCHDLLAIIAAAEPSVIAGAPALPVAVDTGGDAAWGSTIVDFRAPVFERTLGADYAPPPGFHPWRIALEADVDRFRAHAATLFGA
jgi:purine nucleosidase